MHASAVDVVAGGLAEHLVAAAAQGRRRRQGTGPISGPGTRGNFIDSQNGQRAQPSMRSPFGNTADGPRPGQALRPSAVVGADRDGDERSWR